MICTVLKSQYCTWSQYVQLSLYFKSSQYFTLWSQYFTLSLYFKWSQYCLWSQYFLLWSHYCLWSQYFRCGHSILRCHCTLSGHSTVRGRCNLRCGRSTELRLGNLVLFKYQPQVNLIKVANVQNVSMVYIVGYLYLQTSI